jgi:hypothetical protein
MFVCSISASLYLPVYPSSSAVGQFQVRWHHSPPCSFSEWYLFICRLTLCQICRMQHPQWQYVQFFSFIQVYSESYFIRVQCSTAAPGLWMFYSVIVSLISCSAWGLALPRRLVISSDCGFTVCSLVQAKSSPCSKSLVPALVYILPHCPFFAHMYFTLF